MAWYANNGTVSRFGSSRYRLEQSDATPEALFGAMGGTRCKATLYTVTSNGYLTLKAQSGLISKGYGTSNVAIPLVVSTQADVPADGGVALKLSIANDGGTEIASTTFYTPAQTGAVIKVGTHYIVVKADHGYDDEAYDYWFDIFYGGATTYAPDAICFVDSQPVITSPDALFFGAGL